MVARLAGFPKNEIDTMVFALEGAFNIQNLLVSIELAKRSRVYGQPQFLQKTCNHHAVQFSGRRMSGRTIYSQ